MKKIQLGGLKGHGKFALVDDEMYPILSLYKWHLGVSGYPVGYIKEIYSYGMNANILMHNMIMGIPLKGYSTDHINRDKLDNRKENLRTVSSSINTLNRNNRVATSKYRGVHYDKWNCCAGKNWVAQININKRRKSLGYFRTEIEAAIAYNAKSLEVYGEYAVLNNIHN